MSRQGFMNSTRLTLTITQERVRDTKRTEYAVQFVDGAVKLTRARTKRKGGVVVRTVTLGTSPRCDCPAARYQKGKACKHLLALEKHGLVKLR